MEQDVPKSRKADTLPSRPHTMYDSGELDHFNLRKTTGDLHKYSDHRRSVGTTLGPVNENLTVAAKTERVDTAPPKKSGKKRAAPPPPQANNAPKPQTVQVEINVQPKPQDQSRIEDVAEVRMPLKKIHSRNSSDSSGYHELHVSGAESPDANKTDNLQTTLDTTSIDSVEHFNGDSGVSGVSPVTRRSAGRVKGAGSRESSSDVNKPVAPGRKKKRAPLPPPGMSGNKINMIRNHSYMDNRIYFLERIYETLLLNTLLEKNVNTRALISLSKWSLFKVYKLTDECLDLQSVLLT